MAASAKKPEKPTRRSKFAQALKSQPAAGSKSLLERAGEALYGKSKK